MDRQRIASAVPGRQAGGGFTLLELLIVISIIILLVSIGLPAIANFQKEAETAVSMQTINTLKFGLEQYRKDHKGFVPDSQFLTGTRMYGGQCLVQAMTGYLPKAQDGADENEGFRVVPRGTVYKYIDLGDISHARVTISSARDRWIFLDAFKNPILYYKNYASDNPEDPKILNGYQAAHNTGGPKNITDYIKYRLNDSARPPDYFLCTQGFDLEWREPNDTGEEDDDCTSLRGE